MVKSMISPTDVGIVFGFMFYDLLIEVGSNCRSRVRLSLSPGFDPPLVECTLRHQQEAADVRRQVRGGVDGADVQR